MKRVLVVAIAACSGNGASHGTIVDAPNVDAAIDATPPGDAGSAGPSVELMSFGSTPSYAAYRGGSGAWQLATSSDGRTYQLPVDADYEFIAVCASSDGLLDEVEVDALASEGTNFFSCFSDDSLGSATPTITATGTMDEPGVITLFETAVGSAGPWSFAVQVLPSTTQDLFAIGSSSMLIRRGIAIGTGPTQAIAAIDLAADGTALTAEPIAITSLGSDDAIYTQVALSTANGFATISSGSNATSLVLAPASLVESTDEELVDVQAYNATTARELQTTDPTISTFALLAPLDGIAFGSGAATWTTLPTAQRVQFQLTATGQTASVSVSPGWLAATTATSIGFDDVAPGWQSAWSFWRTAASQAAFTVETYDATTYTSTTAYGSGD